MSARSAALAWTSRSPWPMIRIAVARASRAAAASGATWLLPDARVAIPALVSPFGSPLPTDVLVLVDLWLVLTLAAWGHRRIEVPARLWSRHLAGWIGSPGLPAADPSRPAAAP